MVFHVESKLEDSIIFGSQDSENGDSPDMAKNDLL